MPYRLLPYNRDAVVAYAHRWAYGRNPTYYDYEAIGGDCTNFASQCIYAGCGIMNNTPTFGWYYYDANRKAPAWTGVAYLYQFLVRSERSVGPIAEERRIEDLQPGDIVQLSFDGNSFQHSPVVVATGKGGASEILLAAHSEDSDDRPLNTYSFVSARFLHILGAYSL